MRAPSHAPAVRYPYGRSRAACWALVVMVGGGLAGTFAWLALGTANAFVATKGAVGLGLWLLCAAAAWRWWSAMHVGHLVWDGGQWWLDHGPPGQCPVQARPRVHLDLQSHLLLSARPLQGRPLWLWLERHGDPLQWSALRRAVYSPAREEAPHPAQVTDLAPSQPDGGATTKT